MRYLVTFIWRGEPRNEFFTESEEACEYAEWLAENYSQMASGLQIREVAA